MSESTQTISLKEKGQNIIDLIESLRLKRIEIEKGLAVLKMYAELMTQGINPKDVRVYGYDPSKDQRIGSIKFRNSNQPLSRVHNYVILNDGMRVEINPIRVPGY